MKKIKSDTIKTVIVDKLAAHGVALKPRGKAAQKVTKVSRLLAKGANEIIEGTNTLKKKAKAGLKKVKQTAVEVQLKTADKIRYENPSGQYFRHGRNEWAEAVQSKQTKLDYWGWVIKQINS